MRPLSLAIEAFCSMAQYTRIEFEKGTWFLTGRNWDGGDKSDSNGSGKTMMLDAIIWVLFGKTSVGRKGKSIITNGHVRCSVRAEFGDEEPELIVTREIDGKERLAFTYRGQATKGDKDKVQKALCELLDIDYTTFCSTVFLGGTSNSTQFLKAEPSERSKILSHLVNDRNFQEASKLIEQDYKDKQHLLTKVQTQFAVLEAEISHYESTVKVFEENLFNAARAEEVRIQKLEAEITARKGKKMQLRKELEDLHEDLNYSIESLSMRRRELVAQQGANRADADKLASRAGVDPRSLNEGSRCSYCSQTITKETAQKHRNQYDTLMREREAYLKEGRELQLKVAEVDDKIRSHNQALAIQKRINREVDDINTDILHLQDQIQEKPNTDRLESKIAQVRELLSEKLKSKVVLLRDLTEIPNQITILHQLYVGFSRDIKNVMFDLLRDSLECYTDSYIRELTTGDFRVTFPSNSQNIREKFDIILYNGSFEQEIKGYSEGESWRISFAILLALRRVLHDRSRGLLDFVLIDDPVGGLDDFGTRGFIQLLRTMSETECSLVLCTVPKNGFLDESDKQIRVEKRNYRTTVL